MTPYSPLTAEQLLGLRPKPRTTTTDPYTQIESCRMTTLPNANWLTPQDTFAIYDANWQLLSGAAFDEAYACFCECADNTLAENPA